MIRIILLAAIFSLFVHQIVLLPINELEDSQKTVDGKVEVDGEDYYKMEEINKLAMQDETENTKLERLKRQTENSEVKEKPAQPAPANPAPVTEGGAKSAPAIEGGAKSAPVIEGAASGAVSNLPLNFQKQFCTLGITLSILYKMSKY